MLGKVALVAAAAVLAGCATAPSSGDPHAIEERGGSQAADLDRGYVWLQPPTPQPGWDAATIMEGFRVAMADFTDGHAAARRYLTPSLAATWDPDTRTVVYANLQSTTPAGSSEGTFDYTVTPVAVVARDHGFALDDVQESYSAHATRLRGGQWRLSDVRPGTLLSIADFQRAFRPVDVYFPAARGAVLVPDHVFLPVAPSGLPYAMVHQLVHGPTSWLKPAVHAVAPAGTVVRSVQVDADGTARVVLAGTARELARDGQRVLLAALTWTLVGQLPDVKSVRLRIEGLAGPAESPDLQESHDLQDYSSYDPGAFPSGSRATYVDAGYAQQLVTEGQGPRPGAQPALDGATDPVAPVAARGLAAIRRGRHGDVLVLYDGSRWRAVYRAPELSAPTWIPDGSAVWTIASRADGRQRVVAVRLSSTAGTGRVDPVDVAVNLVGSGLRTVGRLSQLRLSRDGTRVAFIRSDGRGSLASARPFVARIDARAGSPSMSGLRPLAPACPPTTTQRCLTGTIDIAWADADNLVVLANTNANDPGTRAPYLVSVDGSSVVPVGTAGLSSDVVSITAAPDVPMIAVVPGGAHSEPMLYVQTSDSWVRRGTGYAVRYPD
jgi:hypothetical protein